MSKSRPTLRDVAQVAGVSHQTVSRVINGSDDVLPETRALVEAAIEEMGYRPNAIARSMARGQSHTLACISPNLTDYTFASVIEGAEVEALVEFLASVDGGESFTFEPWRYETGPSLDLDFTTHGGDQLFPGVHVATSPDRFI